MWDCFLLEGPKVLFRFSLAVLRMHERALLARQDTVSIMRQLKQAAKLAYDVEHLFQISFEVLKPFTRRQDIAAKQACYYKTLKEQAKKMDMEKLARKDLMFSEMEFLSVNQLVIECAAVYDKDKLWLCHGHQNGAQITKVNCEENIMYRLNIELESRVMCMHALDDDIMVLATLSHFVHSYSTKSRRLLWEIRLNDSVLSLASHEEDGLRQVYAGLADGTVAVIEHIEGESPKPEIFYILIGSSPVTCLRLVERKLWCGTGNRVVILNARTLDAIDQFSTSSSCFDYLSMLVSDERGVWLTIRGSSVLQLWDPHSLTCRLLFDVRDHKYPRSPKGEEGSGRITALLPLGGSVLVGTAEGFLVIYDVVTKLSRSPSTAQLIDKKREERMDSGCYSTPCRTPQLMSRIPDERGPDDESSEERSEAAKHSPEPPKKLCTCHQVKSAKCRHCLLEASEALRKLFDKYSLNSAKHVNNPTRYQTLQKANRCEDEEVDAGLGRAISADDVTQWVKSQDSDSYDYDDVFVAYTEDSPRAPRRRRSSNVLDYSWSSDDWKSSSLSSATDVPYAFELNVQEKIKISDKPIKCLLETRCGSETTIISCAGCYGDDEAVLKWTKVGDEELWTNDPIIEVCPYTNAIKPSPYARSRLPRRPPPRATTTLGSGLAKVHNIFLRVHDNTR
ncbi:hypothetical protein JTE90_016766 [Oedothorax gibbosus]|uniref:LRRK2 beta-propeller domain-containing protein n=1 Tax=Oedothorax gibbosus TaxID=931172 RepID=A0AAV6VYK9_9ARAC|nr:hypothetical protein JTE90_016766 [Oedothorax gibbosus]